MRKHLVTTQNLLAASSESDARWEEALPIRQRLLAPRFSITAIRLSETEVASRQPAQGRYEAPER